MGELLEEFLAWMRVRNTSAATEVHRRQCVNYFLRWAHERGLADPREVTRPILESYQRHLYYHRQKNGQPLTFRTQLSRLIPLQTWFRWMVRNHHILYNPASDLDLPRVEKRLPRAILNTQEAEQVLMQPDIREIKGLRDRAILETFYSTGIRRRELVYLKLYNLDRERGTLSVWEGKGKKDRMIPIGERAVAWIDKYLREARPELASDPDDGTIFLSSEGGSFNPDSMSALVRGYVEQAGIGKHGACHMFRHTMATLMLENGADVRYIQEMLGHSDLQSTQVYTQVSIRRLKQIHAATHPAAFLDPANAPTLPAPEKSRSADDPQAVRPSVDPVQQMREALHAEAEEEQEN